MICCRLRGVDSTLAPGNIRGLFHSTVEIMTEKEEAELLSGDSEASPTSPASSFIP